MNKKEAIQYLGNLSIPPMTSNLPEAVIEHQKYIDALRIAQQSLQNEINLIIELEKIKEEIEKKYPYTLSFNLPKKKIVTDCIDILDNHIKELKGE